jgi:hypothetical protein
MRGKPTTHTQAGMPQSVAEVLRNHVVLELVGILSKSITVLL